MPDPVSLTAIGKLLEYLKGFLSGGQHISFYFVAENNILEQKMRENKANDWVIEKFDEYCNKLNLPRPEYGLLRGEMFDNLLFKKFQAGGGSWVLGMPQPFAETVNTMIKITSKYTKGFFNPIYLVDLLCDLGGASYIQIAYGSGKSKVKFNKSTYSIKDKVIGLLPKGEGTPLPPKGGGQTNPRNLVDTWIDQYIKPAYMQYLGRVMGQNEIDNWVNELTNKYPMTHEIMVSYQNGIKDSKEAEEYRKKGNKGIEKPETSSNKLFPLIILGGIGWYLSRK